MTNSKNSFELIAFCEGAVGTKDVLLFSHEFELRGFKLLNNFGFVKSRFVFFWPFLIECFKGWPFSAILLAFFTEGLTFFVKINLVTLRKVQVLSCDCSSI